MKLPTIPPALAGKIAKYCPLSEPIRLQDLEDSARSQAWKRINTPYSIDQHIIRADILRAMIKMSAGIMCYYKKIVILQLASVFLVRVFRNILIPSVRMTLTMIKTFACIICQTIE